MNLLASLTQIIAHTHLFTDAVEYVMVQVPPGLAAPGVRDGEPGAGVVALIRDKDETSLFLPRPLWERSPFCREPWAISPVYRLITLDIPLDFGVVGYLAAWATALAEAGISILTLSAFSRDHLFIPAADFDRAWALLTELIRSNSQ